MQKSVVGLITSDTTLTKVVGLQILGIFGIVRRAPTKNAVTNGYEVYSQQDDLGISEFKYLNGLVNCLHENSKEVYCSGAEVVSTVIYLTRQGLWVDDEPITQTIKIRTTGPV